MSFYNINYYKMNLIDFFKKIPKTQNDIVIFDIDDTLLRPYENNIPVTPVVDFYNFLIENNYNTAIITARVNTDLNLDYTIKDLNSIGINKYNFLILRPIDNINVYNFKEDARKSIYDKGYNALMSIGDSYWDIGKYGGIGILVLPDN
jgi:predicted secreted acid phosphatase